MFGCKHNPQFCVFSARAPPQSYYICGAKCVFRKILGSVSINEGQSGLKILPLGGQEVESLMVWGWGGASVYPLTPLLRFSPNAVIFASVASVAVKFHLVAPVAVNIPSMAPRSHCFARQNQEIPVGGRGGLKIFFFGRGSPENTRIWLQPSDRKITTLTRGGKSYKITSRFFHDEMRNFCPNYAIIKCVLLLPKNV